MFNNKKTVVTIEGMSCNHCKNKVEVALQTIENVNKVKVDLKSKQAIISSKTEVDKDNIKNIVEELGYKVIDIKENKRKKE